jgi:hypothetical protein
MVSPSMASPPLSSTTVPSPPKTAASNLKSNRGRPCDACKRRKQRCVFRDGQDDVCVMCEFQNVPCTFTEGVVVPTTNRKRSGPSADTTVKKRRQKSKYQLIVMRKLICRTNEEDVERGNVGTSPTSSTTPKETPAPVLDRRPPGTLLIARNTEV